MHTELQSTTFCRLCSINLWAMSWKLLLYHVLSVPVTAKFNAFAPEIVRLTKQYGSRGCQKLPGEPSNHIEQSFFLTRRQKAVSDQFWCCEGIPQFMLCTHISLRPTYFQKTPFTEQECRGQHGAPWDGESQHQLSAWLSLLEMTARLLLCPSHDTAISEAILRKSQHHSQAHVLCAHLQVAGRYEIAWLSSCLFFSAKWKWTQLLSCRPDLPWLCSFKSKHLQFSKSKYKYNESSFQYGNVSQNYSN